MADNHVTTLLQDIGRGDEGAPSRLMDAVYDELHALAAAKMSHERRDHTLQPTALVNEAFMRLVGNQGDLRDRPHFFGAAARAMERVLVDHARARDAQKRGGGRARTTLGDLSDSPFAGGIDVLELHEALGLLETESEELAMIVRCRYFLGLTLEETSARLGIPLATLKRRWAFARAWLFERMSSPEELGGDSDDE